MRGMVVSLLLTEREKKGDMSTQTNTALITGSSSGIGLDLARAFLDKGLNVVLNGRNADKLTAAARRLAHPERVAVVPGSIADLRGVTPR